MRTRVNMELDFESYSADPTLLSALNLSLRLVFRYLYDMNVT